MTAGILQLVARGDQDEYLTGNPQVTYYKYTFKRHTNFSMEMMELHFNDIVEWGSMSTCILSHKADMLSNMYLSITLPRLATSDENINGRWVEYVGLAMIKKIELEIGGQTIDSQSGEWMYIYNQLALDPGKRNGYDYMVGFDIDPNEEKTMYIPLTFWFNTHTGLSLPLVALQYHEVKLRVFLRTFKECTINAPVAVPLKNVAVLANFIYLDVEERKLFAKEEQEYIIEQVQHDTDTVINVSAPIIDISFINPVKEIVWVVQRREHLSLEFNDWFNFTFRDNRMPVKSAVLQVNGTDRFMPLPGEYFNLVQTFQHHTNIPDNAGICVYSFAIYPESPQPSGSMNFSRLDSARLKLSLHEDFLEDGRDAFVKLYAVTFNVLRIQAGMGSIKFSR